MAGDRIVFVGHSTVLIELDGVRLLTDPLLRARVAHLRRQVPPVDVGALAEPDAVLVSHLHRDHLDLASLRLLGHSTPMLVPAGAGAWLCRREFTVVSELRAGQAADVGALTVTATPARHDGHRHPGGVRAETLGFLVRGSRMTIYFAGDTALFEGMAELTGDPSSRVDVALLPIAGWGARLGPGHMDPLDAARAVALLRPRIAVPIHWGTLLSFGVARRARRERLREPSRQFAAHVARLAPAVEVRVLQPGEQARLAPASG
jgi:L-ascorbate metabolism protein UlaG (beta-lactamase superfamily)